jgi:glycosyltransferase involved in cell wall biosynthesis
MKISLIQPSRNNLKYLKWSYDSIRKNQGDHEVEICVADDFSDKDGTWGWCQEMMEKDPHFKAIRNEGPTRLGHTILYDRLVNEVATHELCMIYHADMYLCPGALDAIEKQMYSVDTFSREELEQDKLEEYERETGEKIDKLRVKVKNPKTIVSLTRIEPPLHPDGPEKILLDCGIEPEEFDETKLLSQVTSLWEKGHGQTTEGVFAPWAFWKKDFQEIGGHDPIFAPQSKEDTDIFNRFHLNGIKFVQTWEGFVYHMTCRGSRFADGATRNPNGEVFMKNRETDEWLKQNQKSTREFIRKWGHFCKHDALMKPIIPPKYDIGIILEHNDIGWLRALEPWCNNIYCDSNLRNHFITTDQSNTGFNLSKRVLPINNEKNNEILVTMNEKFNQQDFDYIRQLSEILANDDELYNEELPCEFELGNLKIEIFQLNTYEKELVICKQQ